MRIDFTKADIEQILRNKAREMTGNTRTVKTVEIKEDGTIVVEMDEPRQHDAHGRLVQRPTGIRG